MLKQNSDPPEQTAGQVRVKKEEFARALAALEARRQTEAQELEGTVVIGDVLQQLQINLPADEVLQEIKALHTEQPRRKIVRPAFWNAERVATAKMTAGIFLVPVAAVGMAILLLNPLRTSQQLHSTTQPAAPGSMRDLPLYLPLPPLNPAGASGEAMDEGGFNASSVLKPLSSVPDNQPVHCTTASFNQLLASFRSTKIVQPYNFLHPFGLPDPAATAGSSQLFDVRPNLRKPWILIKHDGKLYLRGWVAGQFTQAQAQGHIVTLHSTPQSFDLGVQPRQITLPVNFSDSGSFFSSQGFGRQPAQLMLGSVTLDSHAWEKW